MPKDFKSLTYLVDDNFVDTLHWLSQHQECFDSFHYDVLTQVLSVQHANGVDIIRSGQYLNANYGILLTS